MEKIYLKIKRLFVFASTIFLSTANAQTTYTFNYTGGAQTLALLPGSYSIQCWGANGGSSNGGKGGYATGSISITSPTTAFIYVGGVGTAVNTTGSGNALGGWNGGGDGSCNSTYGTSGGGGGGSDVRMTQNTTYANRIIVAGGGGGGSVPGQYGYVGGNGGGTTGAIGAAYGSYWIGQGGTQTAGGAGTTESNSVVGAGVFGVGGSHSSTAPASGWTGCGGGGGYYGGSAGGAVHSSGGGGSSYIGGVSSGTTIMFGQSGFISNPVVNGNGFVRIIELCNFSLTASNSTLVNSINPSICSGQSLTLTTNAISNYSWSTGSTSSSLVVAPTTNTVYSLTALSPSNCTTTRNISVIVSPGQPTLSVVSSTNQTCLGKTATLTASGAVTYTWSNNVTNGASFTPSVTNTYTVIAQNGCGTATAVTTISISPLAVTMLATPTVVCAGSTSTLNASSAATSYSWFPITASGSSLVVSPIANTVYTVAVSDGTCSGLGTVAVNALPVPTIVATPTLVTVCSGVPVNLTASGAISYTWTPGNLTGSSVTVTPNAPTGYQVVGTNSLGCTSIANAVIITNASPTLSPLASSNFICSGDAVTINASGATTYTWSTGANTSSVSVTPLSTTIYSVSGTTNSCISTETVMITVFVPTLSITGNTSICSGATATLNASGANTYAWSNGFTTANIQVNPTSTTLYTLAALSTSSGINCPSTGSIQVLVKPNPTLTATASRTAMCKGENNTLTVSGALTYSWSTGATTASISITPSLVTNMNYSITGTSSLGCNSTTTLQVKVNSCVGLNNLSLNEGQIKIYPNPSNGDVKVSSAKAIELSLTNEIGQLIRTISLNESNNFELNLSGLSGGIYFVTGVNEDSKFNQKLIITK